MSFLPVCAYSQWSCSAEPYPVSNSAIRLLNSAIGANFLSELAVEKIIQLNLKKNTGSNFKVQLKTYGVKDLSEGKFKSLNISAKEAQIGGFFMKNVHASTICDYNRILFQKDEPPKIFEDFIANFKSTITNDSLNKTIAGRDFQEFFNTINIKTKNTNILKISDPEIAIENDKIKYSIQVEIPLVFATVHHKFTTLSSLRIVDGIIEFADTEIEGLGKFSSKFVTSIFSKINPFQFNFEKNLKTPSFLILKDVNIINNQIELSGVFVALKNQTASN